LLLNFNLRPRRVGAMKHALISLAIPLALVAALAVASPARAASDCYADYKAKQGNPLRLHYGIVQLAGPCKPGPAKTEVERRLRQNGWTLLTLLSVFGPEGLNERRANAGTYYLRF
jgi:hypothetical protein